MVVSQTQIKPLSLSELGKRFEGKVAIVTASTQGIGFAIAHRLGLEGASVVISSRKQQNVDVAAENLQAEGIEVLEVVCHVSNAQQRKNLIDKTVQERFILISYAIYTDSV
ncbi:tropinone reductase-like 3 [Glycine soja]|uniref:Tropinone reductase-like 3 n=1 Tax=Glycine soja TaxID=3848 RepID=A0A445LNI2_GLYSO|nr:tropinone reductase-like 3 [Glycine soja]KHN29987.1 Dehydrogenase/reductase SDR family member 4 [Glycine soja]RZC24547.1 Tropinone reductase-like 3 [Glycine soja]